MITTLPNQHGDVVCPCPPTALVTDGNRANLAKAAGSPNGCPNYGLPKSVARSGESTDRAQYSYYAFHITIKVLIVEGLESRHTNQPNCTRTKIE